MIETAPHAPVAATPVPALPWGAEPGRRDVWPSPAQELLLRAALIPDERALWAWREIRGRIDVATLDGSTQALLPVLRKNLLALGVQDELLGLFKGVHRFSWARNQMLLAPMIAVVRALERAGTPTLLMKGAAFVADRRLDAGMRPMNDLDVLVPHADRGRAIETLLEAGLVPVGGVPAWYVAEYAPRFVPSHGFRDELDRQLDLHWHALHASCQDDADEDFWAAALPIELLGVRTRALCPADELLLVILHGLRWNAIPTYRWVVDAALLCGGTLGEIDYERLVRQARKRRVTVALRAGLEYLRETVAATVPKEAIRALGGGRPVVIERLEHRAQMTQPRARGALQWRVLYHQQRARRELELGRRPTLVRRLELERRRLGIERVGELRRLLAGPIPGPGRPACEVAAAVGRGAGPERTPARTIAIGEPLDFGVPELARDHTAYGTWLAEGEGCWIAGREALLVLGLAEPASTSLLLEVSADGFIGGGCERQRLEIRANGGVVAELEIDADMAPRGEPVVLPHELVGGRERIELLLRTPDASSSAALGLEDDDRRVGVFLRELKLSAPASHRLGEPVLLGEDGERATMLIDGWGQAEPTGRWTLGPRARLLLGLDGRQWPAELLLDATPFLGVAGRRLLVETFVNGELASTFEHDRASDEPLLFRVPVPAARAGAGREISIEWRIHDPRSPHDLGIAPDRRALGLFVRSIVLLETAGGGGSFVD